MKIIITGEINEDLTEDDCELLMDALAQVGITEVNINVKSDDI